MRTEIENWWKQAQADFRTSKNSFESKDYYASVFWCQQAIEKALKAVALEKIKENLGGHSIIYFAQKLKVSQELISGIRDLNPAYLTTRYPDIAAGVPAELYDKEIVERHLKTVEGVLEWAKKQM